VIRELVFASIRQRPIRSLSLLVGYALGVGVTIALLSIGGALVEQARDHDLIGGGDLVVLPAGIDLETLRTGGVSSMYFTIEHAPFFYREVLAGTRFEDRLDAAAPWIEDELLYLELDGELVPISAGATIPSLSERLGVTPDLTEGTWDDVPADGRWRDPSDAELYAALDALHLPRGETEGDSTWAEWHYFNVLLPEDRGWLYLTYMVAGEIPDGRWGGRLLATLVHPGSAEQPFSVDVEPRDIVFSAGHPDLVLGGSAVTIGPDGTYRLTAAIPAERGPDSLLVDLTLAAGSRRYLPPLDIGGAALTSGYTVPLLDGRATGRICAGSRCAELEGARTYHDHNWGTWGEVTWDWGQATLGEYSVLYGGIAQSGRAEGSHFLYLADDDGFAGVYPLRSIQTEWSDGRSETRAPRAISLVAARGRDSLSLRVQVGHTRETELPAGVDASTTRFFQMRGRARLSGTLRGANVDEAGSGFFETWAAAERTVRHE
jgi:hypothetical protein